MGAWKSLTITSLIQVRVVKYDEGTVASQLEGELFEAIRTVGGEDLPHSSLAACQPTVRPYQAPGISRGLLTEPVKVTFFTSGCLQRASLRAGVFAKVVGSTLNTPFGYPAFSARYASVNADNGVSGDGFATIVQPAAKAALAFRNTILDSEFSSCLTPA